MEEESLNLDLIREKLVSEQAQIQNELAETRAGRFGAQGTNPDHTDLAKSYDQQQRQSAIEERLEHRLTQVGEALERLENGTYGYCENCGRKIQPGRLEALPEATLCVQCQSDLD